MGLAADISKKEGMNELENKSIKITQLKFKKCF